MSDSNDTPEMQGRREVAIWWTLALGLLALGVNKQLDLQTALTEIGRILAVQNGWYERRHDVQLEFIYGVVGVASLTAVAMVYLARKSHPATILALVGSVSGYVRRHACGFIPPF